MISFVVVTWDGSKHIRKCLTAIQESLRSEKLNGEIIVVDNGSRDAGLTLKLATAMGAHTISLKRNVGVSTAWNIAYSKSTGHSVIFINQDAKIAYGCVSTMIDALDEYKYPIVVGAKLYFPNSKLIQHAGGIVFLPRCNTRHIGYRQQDSGQFDTINSVDYVTGAVFGCSKRTLEELQGFDSRFSPAYYEDVDFCWRVRAKGGDVLYLPGAVAYHEEASSLGLNSPAFLSAYTRNRLLFVAIYVERLSEFVSAETQWLVTLEPSKRFTVLNTYRKFAFEIPNLLDVNRSMSMSYTIKEILEGASLATL